MALYHTAQGSVSYTTVGSPTIVDGVLSNFNANNYLKFSSQTFSPSSGPFEIQLDYTTGNSNVSYGYSLRLPCINIAQPGGVGRFRVNITTTTETFYLQTNRAANTNYLLKVTYDGHGLYSLYSNGVLVDSKSSTQLNTTSDTMDYTIGVREEGVGTKINLNNTYISVNGQPWFGKCPVEVKSHQIMGAVGYTKVGSPTITDGIASGFSSSDYLETASNLSVTDNTPFDFYMTFTCVSGNTGVTAFSGADDSLSFGYYDSGKKPVFRIRQANNTAYKQFAVNYTMSVNETYSINAVYNGTNLVCYLYDSSSSLLYTETFNGENLNISSSTAFKIGKRGSSAFLGSIDLNHTYIKVNGKLWFYQPQETKYIIRDGKLVWANPNIYLESSGTQYIDLGIKATDTTGASVTYEVPATSGEQIVIGARNGNSGRFFIDNSTTSATDAKIYCGWNNFQTITATNIVGTKQEMRLNLYNNRLAIVAGQTASLTGTLETQNNNIYLFRYDYGTPLPFSGKLYHCLITSGSQLAMDLVPVPAGLVIGNFTVPSNGMFDIVNQQFYGNDGTGTFAIGHD